MIPLLVIAGACAVWVVFFSGGGGASPSTGDTGVKTTGGSGCAFVVPPVKDYAGARGDLSTDNMRAFLDVIAQSEGTANAADPYAVFYGGAAFADKSRHPCEEPMQCDPVLIDPAACIYSTAAGRYQITLSTWNSYGGTAHYGSFDNDAQDQCAADIIAGTGAQDTVASGDVAASKAALASQWASFA